MKFYTRKFNNITMDIENTMSDLKKIQEEVDDLNDSIKGEFGDLAERIELMNEVRSFFINEFETLDELEYCADLLYLLTNIVNDSVTQVVIGSDLWTVLRKNFDDSHDLWSYVESIK